MPYSVVGGPALGFDLARLTAGDQVAGVLRSALACRADDVGQLAARHAGPGPRAEWSLACQAASVDAVVEEGGETALLRRLETSRLGNAHALERMVRRDLLDWTWLHSGPMAVQDPVASEAADVLADAAISGYLRDRLPAEVRRAMAVPFLRSGLTVRDETVPTGMAEVDDSLAILADADAEVRDRWRAVVEELRRHTAQWAPAMHQATWALSVADRLRLACDAQLAGVSAFRRGGFDARDASYGVWNALAGVLQARAVGDLLPASDADVLLRPWRLVYGTGPV